MKYILFVLAVFPLLTVSASYADMRDAQTVEKLSGLMDSIKDPDPAVRTAAARSLGETRESSAVPALSALLTQDKEESVRLAALGALLVIGDRQAMPAYLSALKDESEQVRQSAASALYGLWDETGKKALIVVLLNDRSSKVRRCAAEALGGPGETVMPDPIHPEKEKEREDALIQALKKDQSYEVRASVAGVLGKIKGDNSLEPLIEAMSGDKESSVRAAAAEAVGVFESDKAVEPLINVLYFEKDDTVVANAIKALKYSSDQRIAEPLIARLSSASEQVRWQAIDLLESLRPQKAVEQLRKISEDAYESDGVRAKAKEVLELMGED